MSGIVTVTLAAAVDLSYQVDQVHHGHVNRAHAWSRELSGKGVNVSHAVHQGGSVTRAVVALSPESAAYSSASWLRPVQVAGPTRVNITFAEADGVTTKVNASPEPLQYAELQAVHEQVVQQIEEIDADWVVIAGTVPQLQVAGMVDAAGPGTERLSLSPLIREASAQGARVAVDTSGPALEQVLVEDIEHLALIKPNTFELAEAVGAPLRTVGEVASAAHQFVERGCETVYVSMGADGALGVSAAGTWWARAKPAAVVNSTGAGDSSLAGFLVHAGPGAPDVPAAISGAASFGALSVSQAGTLLHNLRSAPPAQLVMNPDPNMPLSEPAG